MIHLLRTASTDFSVEAVIILTLRLLRTVEVRAQMSHVDVVFGARIYSQTRHGFAKTPEIMRRKIGGGARLADGEHAGQFGLFGKRRIDISNAHK